MKALDEYFLVVVFTLLLNRVHVLAIFIFNLKRNMAVKGLIHQTRAADINLFQVIPYKTIYTGIISMARNRTKRRNWENY